MPCRTCCWPSTASTTSPCSRNRWAWRPTRTRRRGAIWLSMGLPTFTTTTMPAPDVYDTLIIGGGPGGLTAAIYLRRFMRRVAVFDKGNSRASWIPVSHNYPGFPDGVGGKALLENLRAQLQRYGGEITQGEITALRL